MESKKIALVQPPPDNRDDKTPYKPLSFSYVAQIKYIDSIKGACCRFDPNSTNTIRLEVQGLKFNVENEGELFHLVVGVEAKLFPVVYYKSQLPILIRVSWAL